MRVNSIPRLAVAYRLADGGVLVEDPAEVVIVEIVQLWVLLHGELLDVSRASEVRRAVHDNLAPSQGPQSVRSWRQRLPPRIGIGPANVQLLVNVRNQASSLLPLEINADDEVQFLDVALIHEGVQAVHVVLAEAKACLSSFSWRRLAGVVRYASMKSPNMKEPLQTHALNVPQIPGAAPSPSSGHCRTSRSPPSSVPPLAGCTLSLRLVRWQEVHKVEVEVAEAQVFTSPMKSEMCSAPLGRPLYCLASVSCLVNLEKVVII